MPDTSQKIIEQLQKLILEGVQRLAARKLLPQFLRELKEENFSDYSLISLSALSAQRDGWRGGRELPAKATHDIREGISKEYKSLLKTKAVMMKVLKQKTADGDPHHVREKTKQAIKQILLSIRRKLEESRKELKSQNISLKEYQSLKFRLSKMDKDLKSINRRYASTGPEYTQLEDLIVVARRLEADDVVNDIQTLVTHIQSMLYLTLRASEMMKLETGNLWLIVSRVNQLWDEIQKGVELNAARISKATLLHIRDFLKGSLKSASRHLPLMVSKFKKSVSVIDAKIKKYAGDLVTATLRVAAERGAGKSYLNQLRKHIEYSHHPQQEVERQTRILRDTWVNLVGKQFDIILKPPRYFKEKLNGSA
jgi:hypothetical protein